MNNEKLRQRAQEIADEYGNDAYSVALAMLEREGSIDSLKKIKAEAVREALFKTRVSVVEDGPKWLCRVNDLMEYADKLENQNDS